MSASGPKAVRQARQRGLTMVELMVAMVVLLPVLLAVVQNLIQCTNLNEQSRATLGAVWGVRSRMTAIEHTPFNNIVSAYNNTTFTIPGMNGIGRTVIFPTNTDPLKVTVSFCWRGRTGRVTGEDQNLNGVLDAGEDKNGNGLIDSPAMATTWIGSM